MHAANADHYVRIFNRQFPGKPVRWTEMTSLCEESLARSRRLRQNVLFAFQREPEKKNNNLSILFFLLFFFFL